MKEFIGYPGGRTLFNEDIENLKELALSFSHFFENAGFNFIISGCTVNSSHGMLNISEGYIWLDGKIRKFSGASWNYTPQNIYFVPKDSDGQSINYNTKGVSGIMSKNYEVVATTIAPTSGPFIKYAYYQTPDLNTFFSHYGLSKTAFYKNEDEQELTKDVKFNKTVTANAFKITGSNYWYAIVSLNSDFNIKVDLYNPYNVLQKSYVFNYGLLSYNANGSNESNLAHGFNRIMQCLPTVTTNEIVANKLNVNGKIVDGNFLNDVDISDWIPMMKNNIILANLYVKHIYNQVFISGLFPILSDSDIISHNSAGNHCYEYMTSIMLPSMIPLPIEKAYFPVRCKNQAGWNTSIVCYFKADRHLYFRGHQNGIKPTVNIAINWHYQY